MTLRWRWIRLMATNNDQWEMRHESLTDGFRIIAAYEHCMSGGQGEMNVLFHNFLLTVTATLRVSLVTARSGPIVKLSLNQHQSILWYRVTKSFCNTIYPPEKVTLYVPLVLFTTEKLRVALLSFWVSWRMSQLSEWHMTCYLWAEGELTSANQGPGLSGRGPMRGRESGRGPGPGKICWETQWMPVSWWRERAGSWLTVNTLSLCTGRAPVRSGHQIRHCEAQRIFTQRGFTQQSMQHVCR